MCRIAVPVMVAQAVTIAALTMLLIFNYNEPQGAKQPPKREPVVVLTKAEVRGLLTQWALDASRGLIQQTRQRP